MENDQLQNLISTGIKKLEQAQFKAAIDIFFEALKYDAVCGYLYYLLATAYHDWYCSKEDASQIKEALKYAKLALQAEPNNAFSHYIMGIILLQLRKKYTARQHLKQAIMFDPTEAKFHARLGETFKPKKKAINHYYKALQLDPNCLVSLLGLSHYYFFIKNNREKSYKFAYKALTLNPMNSSALTIMGFILHAKGDHLAAKEHASLVINQDPMNHDALRLICLLESKNIFIKIFYKLGLCINNLHSAPKNVNFSASKSN